MDLVDGSQDQGHKEANLLFLVHEYDQDQVTPKKPSTRKTCAVMTCVNPGVHEFPRNGDRRKQWIKATRVDEQQKKGYRLSGYSGICSDHFLPKDFFFYKGTAKIKKGTFGLKDYAVPSIFPWSPVPPPDPVQSTFNPPIAPKTYSRLERRSIKQYTNKQQNKNKTETDYPRNPLKLEIHDTEFIENVTKNPLPETQKIKEEIDDTELNEDLLEIPPPSEMAISSVRWDKQARQGLENVTENPLPDTQKIKEEIDDTELNEDLLEIPPPSEMAISSEGWDKQARQGLENVTENPLPDTQKIKEIDDTELNKDLLEIPPPSEMAISSEGRYKQATQGQTSHDTCQQETKSEQTMCDASIQTDCVAPFSVYNYLQSDEAINFYTGLENLQKLKYLFSTLGDCSKLEYFYPLPPPQRNNFEQFFMTLMILQRHTFKDISILYLMPLKHVANIFITWVCLMASQWRSWGLWRDSVAVDELKFSSMSQVLPQVQQLSFALYENEPRISSKFMIGVAPSGLIKYISPCCSSSSTYRDVIESCHILQILNETIMLNEDVEVETMCFMKRHGKECYQINASNLIEEMNLASKRIHVERIIDMLKTYTILNRLMNEYETQFASVIVFVCATLVNFRLKENEQNFIERGLSAADNLDSPVEVVFLKQI